MFSDHALALAKQVIASCQERKLKLATAESCTGGLIAGCLTAVPGASGVFGYGFITYADRAKTDLLGVGEDLLKEHGAVSEAVARAMAEGAIAAAKADLAVSVTGIAGPGGGSPEKPVGLVHLSVARKGYDTGHEKHLFAGGRDAVRRQTVEAALRLLLRAV